MIQFVTLQQLALSTQTHGQAYSARVASVAAPLGAKHIGARYVEVPPGKKHGPIIATMPMTNSSSFSEAVAATLR